MKIKNMKIKNKKKIGILLFFGRRRYTEILFRYLIRDLRCNKGVIDKIFIFKNTNDINDLNHLDSILNGKYGKYFTILENVTGYSSCFSALSAFDDSWTFIKLDDDIVYVEENAIYALSEFQRKIGGVVSGNVINHTYGSHIHQRLGAFIDEGGFNEWIPYNPYDEKNLRSGEWAKKYHENFMVLKNQNRIQEYKFNEWVFLEDHLFSINVICWNPGLMKDIDFSKIRNEDDEVFISKELARIRNKKWRMYGKYLFSHWAYGPQRHYLDHHCYDILMKYKEISKKEGMDYL